MAFPLLALALALTAAGAGANYVGARKAQEAQADAMAAERIRQQGFDEQADAINKQQRKRYTNFSDQQAQKAAALEDLFVGKANEDMPDFGPTPSSSNITVQHENEAKAEAKGYTDQQGRAQAKLLSFGDLFGDIGVKEGRDATRLAGIQGFRRGSQSVLPLELQAAQEQGQGWRLGGDILGGLGSIATMGALTGATFPGLKIFGGARPLAGTNMLANQPGNGLLSLFG